jgi:hypothetical protein
MQRRQIAPLRGPKSALWTELDGHVQVVGARRRRCLGEIKRSDARETVVALRGDIFGHGGQQQRLGVMLMLMLCVARRALLLHVHGSSRAPDSGKGPLKITAVLRSGRQSLVEPRQIRGIVTSW